MDRLAYQHQRRGCKTQRLAYQLRPLACRWQSSCLSASPAGLSTVTGLLVGFIGLLISFIGLLIDSNRLAYQLHGLAYQLHKLACRKQLACLSASPACLSDPRACLSAPPACLFKLIGHAAGALGLLACCALGALGHGTSSFRGRQRLSCRDYLVGCGGHRPAAAC